VHQVGRGPRGHAGQQAALYTAAREISLGGDLRLSGVLYTDAGQLEDLIGRVRLRARWPDGRRPHGVLVFTAERLEGDVIVAVSGTRLTVEGLDAEPTGKLGWLAHQLWTMLGGRR